MLYWFIRLLFRLILVVLHPLRVEGVDSIPTQEPVIITSNHTSWWDPVILAVITRRPVNFMAKIELFRYPVFGAVLRGVGAFPVRRGQADRAAVRRALEVLGAGGALGLFVEGTRSRTGQLRLPELGVAMLALKTGAPVIPVAIHGPYRPFRPLRVEVCEPVNLVRYRDRKMTSPVLWDASMEIMTPLATRLGRVLPSREGVS